MSDVTISLVVLFALISLTCLFFICCTLVRNFFIRTFWADKTLGMLEYHITNVSKHIMVTIIEPAKLIDDDINKEVQAMRKTYLKNLYQVLGHVNLKYCIILFGGEDSFVAYIGIRFEEFFRSEAIPVLMSNRAALMENQEKE